MKRFIDHLEAPGLTGEVGVEVGRMRGYERWFDVENSAR